MLVLSIDGGPSVDLDDTPMLYITSVDYGTPDIREVSDPRPAMNGMDDRTAFIGARAVSLEGKVALGPRQQVFDLLGPFLNPAARCWLTRQFDDGSRRRIRLRADQFSSPIIGDVRDVQVSWKAPDGILESADERSAWMQPLTPSSGRSYPLIYNRVYPAGAGSAIYLVNAGTIPANWVARIYGPITSPALVNGTTGEAVTLTGLTLLAGDWVEVSSRDNTVYASGDPAASRYSTVDFAATNWWQLAPGATPVHVSVATSSAPATVEFVWHDTYI